MMTEFSSTLFEFCVGTGNGLLGSKCRIDSTMGSGSQILFESFIILVYRKSEI